MTALLRAFLTLVAGAVTVCADDDPRRPFQWRLPLAGPFQAGVLYRTPVTPEVYDGCAIGPSSDLRVFDEAGRQWPFLLWTPPEPPPSVDLPCRRLNRVEFGPPERGRGEDIDLATDARLGRGAEHDELAIRTSGSEFLRRVEVHGRPDERSEWALVGAGYLVRHVRGASAANDAIRYPPCTFPHLRIRVHADARRGLEEFAIEDVAVRRASRHSPPLLDVALRAMAVEEADRTRNAQVTIFDTGAKDLPLEDFVVTAVTPEYARALNVYARNQATDAWHRAASGEIHRLGGRGDAQATVAVRRSGRFWKLEIFHHDDPPLEGVSVEGRARPRWIAFDAAGPGPAALYFGAPGVGPARYDLGRRKIDADYAAAAPAAGSPRTPNPLWRPGPPAPPRWMVPAGVAVASGLVLWVILRMLRSTAAGGSPSRTE